MDFKIVEFDEKYSKDIYELETTQWGVWGNEAEIKEVNENEIVLIGLFENEFAGVITGEWQNDVFHIAIACVKPEFQGKGLGTKLLTELIVRAKQKFKFSKFTAEAISVYGKINAKKMLENAKFKLVKVNERYWGNLFPDVLCLECNKKPCECDALVYELNIKDMN